uniref:Neuronal PAS domain-containing protein 4-like n=1 Tax=Cyprinodon variegatus TaxID=28743 RepID=A0A3Q2FFT3_CYPVA
MIPAQLFEKLQISTPPPLMPANMVSHRSTKGASKARRDHINREIRNMRSLLPITQEDQERLSYLHSMAAICTYIRKSVLFQGKLNSSFHPEGLPAGERSPCSLQYEAFLEALHGFILVTTAQGRLVYVSENVAKYIGLSMVDVLQGDSFYDLVEHSDVDIVKSNLNMGSNLFSERSFVCCMQTTKAFKLQHGSCCSMLPLFVALCTPTVNRLTGADSHFCPSFSSTHRLDMSFTQVSESVLYYVGYSAEEMINRSWYNLLHPGDLSLAAASHKSLMQAEEGFQVEMILRLQCRDLSWTWIYIRANKDPECQSISCTNYIIRYDEPLMQPLSDNVSENPALFTPPYSPASSSSPLQQEELNPDLLMDAHGCKDPLQSSPEASPSYYSYQNVGLSCHQSPADSLQMTEQEFERRDFDMFSSSSSSTSPVTLSQNYDFQACSANSRLVPDSFSMSEMCESQVECASLHPDDFSLLDDPTWGSLVPPLQMPHQEILMHSSILTPIQSPVAPELYLYDEREQEEISILAQQISSLFSSFDMHHGQNPLQNVAPVANADCDLLQASPLPLTLHPKHEPVYDDCTLDSILKDLNMVSRKSSAPSPDMSYSYQQGPASGNSLPAEQLSKSSIALDPFGVQLGSHDQNVGLHQLNHYMQSSFQQGKHFQQPKHFYA